MGNQSRAAKGRGLTSTGQRVVARTRQPAARSVAPRPPMRARRSSSLGERERALRHIASSAYGRRSKNPKIVELMEKVVDAVNKLREHRQKQNH